MSFRLALASSLMVLPRAKLSYAFYCLAPILILEIRRKVILNCFIVLFVFFVLFFINFLFYNVSFTAFVLECALIFPLFILICGGKAYQGGLHYISLMAFVLSIFNMMSVGFPFLLPYQDYLPDYYSAFYGVGGAKLVTVIGFFSLLVETQEFNHKKIGWLVVALSNFIMPNYILGILCGGIALIFSRIKGYRSLILFGVFVALIFPYIEYRLINIDNTLMDEFNYHPKILAYITLVELWIEYPHSFFVGVGLGQFCSYPALWASDYMGAFSSHSIPDLPYFSMTEFHDRFLGKYLKLGEVNKWALSSSANKPYTSFSALIAEMGALPFFFLVVGLVSCYRKLGKEYCLAIRPVIIFVFLMFFIDLWHDVPVFIFCLALCLRELKEIVVRR